MSKKNDLIKNTISNICSGGCFYCGECPRKAWVNTPFAPVPGTGKNKQCPLLAFEAEQKTIKPFSFEPADRVTEKDCERVCSACEYGKQMKNADEKEATTIFCEHCVYCPCQQVKESIWEAEAEAACS